MRPSYPFRGAFDLHPWADSRRNPHTGRIVSPLGPAHVCRPTLDGSYELRPQIAHRLTWWLTEMRLRAHMNQGELGDKLGTTQAAVAKWERGRTLISLDRLAEFGDVTRVPIALYFDLMGSPGQRAMWL